jgi:hypothetical protein
MIMMLEADRDKAEAATRRWLERAVIGLNLCPFAKGVYSKALVHFSVSSAHTSAALLEQLRDELAALVRIPETQRETTVVIAPCVMADFLDFNFFLKEADLLLEEVGLVGQIQIASFHPGYQFASVPRDDITNYTNRSPYPILHLLREISIERAVEDQAEAQAIYGRNMETLTALGQAGWDALGVGAHQ